VSLAAGAGLTITGKNQTMQKILLARESEAAGAAEPFQLCVILVDHREDGGGFISLQAGETLLAQVALTPQQKRLLGYELILGNHFGQGKLPVRLVSPLAEEPRASEARGRV